MVSDHSKIPSAQTILEAAHSCSQPVFKQIIGEFLEDLPESQEYLLLVFSPSSVPLKKRWRTNGLSANFLADYLAVFFPGDEDNLETINQQEQIQSTVSYIANELLENAMKFSDHRSGMSIKVELHLYPNKIIFSVTNSIQPDAMQKYQTFIQEAIAADPSDTMLHRLEQIASDDTLKSSGLGLVTMMNNYAAKLGWKFETVLRFLESQSPELQSPESQCPETIAVTTMVQVSV